jgi:hypothetical protein
MAACSPSDRQIPALRRRRPGGEAAWARRLVLQPGLLAQRAGIEGQALRRPPSPASASISLFPGKGRAWFCSARSGGLRAGLAPGAMQLRRHFAGQGALGAEAVEQLALGIGAQQAVVGMLAVNVGQEFAGLAQLGEGRRQPLMVGARTAVRRRSPAAAGSHRPASKSPACSQRSSSAAGRELELGGDLGLVGARRRTVAGSARSPSASDRASTRIDLPAPVSPVSAPKPEANSSSSSSTMT